MNLSSHQAQAVINGAEAKAREFGSPVAIAVLDAGGHLKAFRRMDGAILASIALAIRRASSAVLFQASSELGVGLPLTRANGSVIGSLGISGGTATQDAEIAQAALAAFKALSR